MDNYEFQETIGEGTYGVVYKCQDKRTKRIVAVKQFKNFQTNAYVRCTMMRELRVEQLLKGEPNVTQLLDTFKQNNRLYLVMEYIPRSLLDVLERNKSGVPEKELIVLLYTLLLGIRSCHHNGIIHRDVKPENILVHDDGTTSLCDFGFCRPVPQQLQQQLATSSRAREMDGEVNRASERGRARFPASPSATANGSSSPASWCSANTSALLNELVLADHRSVMTDYVATRWYRSPEMLLGMPSYNYAVDMWAVGAIMAEIIDGEPLLPGKTELEQLSLIQTRIGDFPAAYEAAVRKRNGGMLRLRSLNPFVRKQSVGKSKAGSVGVDEDCGQDAAKHNDYINARYRDRIQHVGMHLLHRLLCVDAAERITVEQALAHPYFDAVRHDPRFGTLLTGEDSNRDASEDEREAEGQDLVIMKGLSGKAQSAAVSPVPLPKLTPMMRGERVPAFAVSTAGDGLLNSAKGGVDGGSAAGGATAAPLEQCADKLQMMGRPPRASAWAASPSAQTAVTLDMMTHESSAADFTGDAIEVAHNTANTTAMGDDGASPPPRSVPPANALSGAVDTPAARRHAVSEETSATAPKSSRDVSAKSESRIATLLFKTKRSKHGATLPTRSTPTLQPELQQQQQFLSPLSDTHRSSTDASFTLNPVPAAVSTTSASTATTPTTVTVPTGAFLLDAQHASLVAYHTVPPKSSADGRSNSVTSHGAAQAEEQGVVKRSSGPDTQPSSECKGREKSAPLANAARKTSAPATAASNLSTRETPSKNDKRKPLRPSFGRVQSRRQSSTRGTPVTGSVRCADQVDSSNDNQRGGRGSTNASPIAKRTPTKYASASAPRRRAQHQPSVTEELLHASPTWDNRLPHRVKLRALADSASKEEATSFSSPSHRRDEAAAATSPADNFDFASPTLPREIKPLRPKERMTLLMEIESLGFPVSTPSAVEVMMPTTLSPAEEIEDDELAGDEHTNDAVISKGTLSPATATTKPAVPSKRTPLSSHPAGLPTFDQLSTSAPDDGLFVEDLDSHESVSPSILLSDTTGRGDSNAVTPTAAVGEPEASPRNVAFALHVLSEGTDLDSTASDDAAAPLVDFAFSSHRGSAAESAADANLDGEDGGAGSGVRQPFSSLPTSATRRRQLPRVDGGLKSRDASASNASSRAAPSLFFRSSRTASSPLKLATTYMSQSAVLPRGGLTSEAPATTSTLAVVGGGGGGGASSTASVAAVAPPSLTAVQGGSRPSPALLRHAVPKPNASLPALPSFPLELPFSPDGHGGSERQHSGHPSQPLSASGTPQPSRDSPRVPASRRLSACSLHTSTAHYTPREEVPQRSLSDLHQRRLSNTPINASVSGELYRGSEGLTRSRRSHETNPPPLTNSLQDTPVANVDDLETEVLVDSPRTPSSHHHHHQHLHNRHHNSNVEPFIPQRSNEDLTPSSARSVVTAIRSGGTTREGSTATRHVPHDREESLPVMARDTPDRLSFSHATSAKCHAVGLASTARSSGGGQRTPASSTTTTAATTMNLADTQLAVSFCEDEELPGRSNTFSFPLCSGTNPREKSGSRSWSARERPLTLTPPRPALRGTSGGVGGGSGEDAMYDAQRLHAVMTHRKGRLIL